MNTTTGPFDAPNPPDVQADPLPTPAAADRHPDGEPGQPAWHRRVDRTPLRSMAPLLVLVTATFAVTTQSGHFRSLGVAIALTVLFAAVAKSGARDKRAAALTLGGIALLPWLAIRHSPWLIAVDVVVAAALLITAASVRPDRPLAPRFITMLFAWRNAVGSATNGPHLAAAEIAAAASGVEVRGDQVKAVLRTSLVAGSVVALAALVLFSGDALIASYLPTDLDVGRIWAATSGPLVGACVGSSLFVGLVGIFRSTGGSDRTVRSVRAETLLVTMAGLVLTIGAYGVVQIIAVASGPAYVEARTGLTYAEYARSGFFEVVTVTVLTVMVLTAVRSTRRSRPDRARTFMVLAGLLTAAVVSLVATSVVKLGIYTDRYGLTMLRVYTIVFAIWLGLVALLTFAALVRSSDRWLTPVVLVSIVIGAFGMNVANPERRVAEHNIDRARGGAELDLDYLELLSDDATPTILAGMSELGIPIERNERWTHPTPWCRMSEHRSGFAANLAVEAAADAQAEFCPPRR